MYKTVQELQKKIDSYFATVPEDETLITWLALHLWFTSRQALINYQEKPEFVDAIKKAKLRIEQSYEKSLRKNGRSWDIFALKNFDWRDKQEVDHWGQQYNPIKIDQTIDIKDPAQIKNAVKDLLC